MKATTKITTSLAIAATLATNSHAFAPTTNRIVSTTTTQQHSTQLYATGFGKDTKPEPREKSEGQVKREQKSSKYDEIAATGGQEYRIFVRQFGSADDSWLPVGSIAVPRGAQVADAVFADETALQGAIVRAYPKLKGMEIEFEYGYNLKIYPGKSCSIVLSYDVCSI